MINKTKIVGTGEDIEISTRWNKQTLCLLERSCCETKSELVA